MVGLIKTFCYDLKWYRTYAAKAWRRVSPERGLYPEIITWSGSEVVYASCLEEGSNMFMGRNSFAAFSMHIAWS